MPRETEISPTLAVVAYVILLMVAARASVIQAIEFRPDVHRFLVGGIRTEETSRVLRDVQ